MTPLTHKINALLAPDPDGRPMAPETEALLRAAAKAEEEDCRRAVEHTLLVYELVAIRSVANILKSKPNRLDHNTNAGLCVG